MMNAALIGVGNWGKRLVRSVQGKSDKVRFTRGVTRTPSKAADFARDQGLAVDSDLASLLADPAIQGVVIATPNSLHGDIATAAVKAGKHALVIKPLASSQASAIAATEAARKSGVVLAVSFPWQFLPTTAEIKRLVTSGELGIVSHVEGNYCMGRYLIRNTGNWQGHPSENPPGGLTTHSVDLLVSLMGEVEEVYCRSLRRATQADIDDTTSMLLQFKAGMTGYIAAVATTGLLYRTTVFGSKGWAQVRDDVKLETRTNAGLTTVKEFPAFDQLRGQMEAFAAAAAGGAPYPISPEQAIHEVAVAEAIQRSAADNVPIKVI